MKELSTFRAVHASGCLITDPSSVPAMALLFEKVYLPRNLEFVLAFAKRYSFTSHEHNRRGDVTIEPFGDTPSSEAPLADLTPAQRETALRYLRHVHKMVGVYAKLFPHVFETDMFPKSNPVDVQLLKKGLHGQKNLYRVRLRPLLMTMEDDGTLPALIKRGYIPLITNIHTNDSYTTGLNHASSKELAALLGMQAVGLMLPATRAAEPDVILDARERLSEHLPPFWSAMLKLTRELKIRMQDSKTPDDVLRESQDLVDTLVRPALIDLQAKLEKERRLFFYRILAPIQKGLRLLVGNPPLTQQQLITNALILGADVAMSAAGHMQTIEALKREPGLTFLLEVGKMWDTKSKSPTK
jgi:hypothetical protein